MARSLALGNGNILVCLDEHGYVRDFYFPYVGLENHIGGGFKHRIGVWVDGTLNWLDDTNWQVVVESAEEALMGILTARNKRLGVELYSEDIVYNEKNIFLRTFTIKNTGTQKRVIKLFIAHEFELYEAHRGDTAYFDPVNHTIIHYSGQRVFLINGKGEDQRFDDYTTGSFHANGKEGSFRDAEDGLLSRNAIEHGTVDSVIGFYREFEPEEEKKVEYWITADTSIPRAQTLNEYILARSPQHLKTTSHDYWRAWSEKNCVDFHGLNKDIVNLFRTSLFTIRAHSDNGGAIIASSDSDMLQGGKDTYAYMWPRDGAFSALALDMAGEENVSQRFFKFCNEVLSDDGYFMHKYRSDGALGSSWHPWIRNGRIELPIQEDETAIVIYALWNHYQKSHDLEFVERVYNSLVKKAADFMVSFRDGRTGLPRPSYDLWEEKFGISTYTAASVYGALQAAAKFADLLGKKRSAEQYAHVAEEIRSAIMKYLYDAESETFVKMIASVGVATAVEQEIDRTVDMSSVYGIFRFEVLPKDDERLQKAMRNTQNRLTCQTSIGGIARYEGDDYYRRTMEDIPGNPWMITSLWAAQYAIARAETKQDMTVVHGWLAWIHDHATKSGMLPEQIDTNTGAPLSAMPLTWSHAEFVMAVIAYLNRIQELGVCEHCNTKAKMEK